MLCVASLRTTGRTVQLSKEQWRNLEGAFCEAGCERLDFSPEQRLCELEVEVYFRAPNLRVDEESPETTHTFRFQQVGRFAVL